MFRSRYQKICIGIIVLFAAMVVGNLRHQWGFPDTRFPLEKGEKVKLDAIGATQTFLASRNGLSGVNILFGGSQIKNGGTLSLALLDANCQKKISETTTFVTSLGADDAIRFPFAAIPDSQGKTFCFTAQFAPKEGSKKAALFVIPNTLPNEVLSLSLNGTVRPNESLSFRPIYQNKSLIADLVELDQRISQYKPWFLKGTLLANIVLLSIGLTFGFLILAVMLTSKKLPEET